MARQRRRRRHAEERAAFQNQTLHGPGLVPSQVYLSPRHKKRPLFPDLSTTLTSSSSSPSSSEEAPSSSEEDAKDLIVLEVPACPPSLPPSPPPSLPPSPPPSPLPSPAPYRRSGDCPNVHWRAIPFPHLRQHPSFQALPPSRPPSRLADLRFFRQDSWEWRALHVGRLTTSRVGGLLGGDVGGKGGREGGREKRREGEKKEWFRTVCTHDHPSTFFGGLAGFYEPGSAAILKVPRSLTSTARATAARLHLLELPPPGRDYVAFLNTLRGHVEGEGEGGTEESGEGPRKALWVAAGKRRQGERKGSWLSPHAQDNIICCIFPLRFPLVVCQPPPSLPPSLPQGATLLRLPRDDAYLAQMLRFVGLFIHRYIPPPSSNRQHLRPLDLDFFLKGPKGLNSKAERADYRSFLEATLRIARSAQVVARLSHHDIQRSPHNLSLFLDDEKGREREGR
ncbi:hypothetical protein NSK_001797 [Nannochloropsis salina CCMP1776]|uniref:Uncharacterized protein n=1 Tax=Nannochloropsis salina CCMP1776 TaxID=1027361 RepID=A0A4D9DDM4_9STRA|nr:hypothetical protein NSK_001797 [Nannochloropsis salina CCMP1776]|eukprot:TFJ86709.1 hypothetical protein NSK_001797 [Nannochloropsis salina CCMP1776]